MGTAGAIKGFIAQYITIYELAIEHHFILNPDSNLCGK
jgi:hypothetical protein